jgi:hypothetical protein
VRKAWLLLFVSTSTLIVWLCAPALTGASSFAFRDAAHFYHPLFEYICGEWGAGRIPLWNPYENLGVPLVAENTSSVFYPGKLLFALPLDYTWLYNMYIVGHVALAAGTSYRLARHLRASTLGSIVGALSYAFSGTVLFQYCNVIFLVGAAWLPLALLFADRMLRLGQPWATVGFGVTVALVVLGGDPHLAYNVGLVSAGYALLLWWNSARRIQPTIDEESRRNSAGPISTAPGFIWRLGYLASGSLLAGLLAAVQVLPSIEASPYGERSHFDEPRNIYEVAQSQFSSPGHVSYQGLYRGSKQGHHSHVYAFSLAPWRLAETIWPNSTGALFPAYRRWLLQFNAEDTVWIPSLYFGLFPLCLAVNTLALLRGSVCVRGLSWLALLGIVGSFGSYGLGYLAKQVLGTGNDLDIGDEFGGLYWLLCTFAPGYVQFRYPAKLLVMAAIGMSMLAALGWRRAWTAPRSLIRLVFCIPLLSAAVGIGALLIWPSIAHLSHGAEKPEFLRRFDWEGAWTNYFDGLIHASLLAIALGSLLVLAQRAPRLRQFLQMAVVAIVVLDLAVAQSALFDFAPAEMWKFKPAFVAEHPEFANRVYRLGGFKLPSAEDKESSPFVKAIEFERQSLSPKYPLPLHIRSMPAAQSVAGADFDAVLEAARIHSKRTVALNTIDPSVLDMLNIQCLLVAPDDVEHFKNARCIANDIFLSERASFLPRAWIVHRVETVPPFASHSQIASREFASELLFRDNKPRNWREVAVIETIEAVKLPGDDLTEVTADESCTIVRDEPLQVEINAKLTALGLVVLADQYFPGWELTVETDGVAHQQPILRTNRVLRGAVLPPGEHRLIYRYQPSSFYVGASISAFACAGLAIATFARWRRKRGAN